MFTGKRKVKKDTLENRMNLANTRFKVPHAKMLTGSTTGKFPVVLDGGKTIVFISDKSKESETRLKYELRKGNIILPFSAKHNS